LVCLGVATGGYFDTFLTPPIGDGGTEALPEIPNMVGAIVVTFGTRSTNKTPKNLDVYNRIMELVADKR
jgi:hypothetical protein